MGEDPRISLLTNNNTRLQEELLEQKRHENNMRKRLEDKLADLEETQRLQ